MFKQRIVFLTVSHSRLIETFIELGRIPITTPLIAWCLDCFAAKLNNHFFHARRKNFVQFLCEGEVNLLKTSLQSTKKLKVTEIWKNFLLSPSKLGIWKERKRKTFLIPNKNRQLIKTNALFDSPFDLICSNFSRLRSRVQQF